MTSLSRAGLLVAIVAALLGAPSVVRAAPPNALSGATVQPSSGSTATAFSFRVQYRSRAGIPAGAVSVSVGARTLGMLLVAGTATDGTYQVTASVPSGMWSTVFSARTLRGKELSISGPLVRVSPASTPAPTPEPTPRPLLKPSAAPTLSVVEPPDGTPAPTIETAPGAVTTGDDATPQAEPQPTDRAGSTEKPGGAPAPRGGKGRSAEPAAVPSNRHSTGVGSRPSPDTAPIGGIDDPWSDGGLPSIPLLVVVFGAGAAALGAFAWFLLGRRRRDEEDAAAAAASAAEGAEAVSQRIAQRAARRQRLDPSDDPIIAALGLPKSGERPAAPRGSRRH